MKARIQQFQEGLDFFCKDEGWKKIYEDAPDGTKEELELKFFDQWRDSIGQPLSVDEFITLGELCTTPLTKADWEYNLMFFAKDPRQIASIKKQIASFSE